VHCALPRDRIAQRLPSMMAAAAEQQAASGLVTFS